MAHISHFIEFLSTSTYSGLQFNTIILFLSYIITGLLNIVTHQKPVLSTLSFYYGSDEIQRNINQQGFISYTKKYLIRDVLAYLISGFMVQATIRLITSRTVSLFLVAVIIVMWVILSGLHTLAYTAEIKPVAGKSTAQLQYNRMMFQQSISIFYTLYRYFLMAGIVAYYCLYFYK